MAAVSLPSYGAPSPLHQGLTGKQGEPGPHKRMASARVEKPGAPGCPATWYRSPHANRGIIAQAAPITPHYRSSGSYLHSDIMRWNVEMTVDRDPMGRTVIYATLVAASEAEARRRGAHVADNVCRLAGCRLRDVNVTACTEQPRAVPVSR
jgi:hypothetical protein